LPSLLAVSIITVCALPSVISVKVVSPPSQTVVVTTGGGFGGPPLLLANMLSEFDCAAAGLPGWVFAVVCDACALKIPFTLMVTLLLFLCLSWYVYIKTISP
jgi:hypothetical protein